MNYLFPSPKLIKLANETPSKTDIHSSAQNILQGLGVQVQLIGTLPRSKNGILFLADHRSSLDLFILYAELTTKKLFFIGGYINHLLGKVWQQQMLPVYFSYRPINEPFDLIRQFFWQHHENCQNREKAHAYNRETITRAAKLLQQNKHVLLFPGGNKVQNSHQWAKGVGHLVSQANDPNLQIVFLHLTGSRYRNTLRQFLPSFLLKILGPKRVRVYIRPALKLSNEQLLWSPSEITSYLNQTYHAHSDKIKKGKRHSIQPRHTFGPILVRLRSHFTTLQGTATVQKS